MNELLKIMELLKKNSEEMLDHSDNAQILFIKSGLLLNSALITYLDDYIKNYNNTMEKNNIGLMPVKRNNNYNPFQDDLK